MSSSQRPRPAVVQNSANSVTAIGVPPSANPTTARSSRSHWGMGGQWAFVLVSDGCWAEQQAGWHMGVRPQAVLRAVSLGWPHASPQSWALPHWPSLRRLAAAQRRGSRADGPGGRPPRPGSRRLSGGSADHHITFLCQAAPVKNRAYHAEGETCRTRLSRPVPKPRQPKFHARTCQHAAEDDGRQQGLSARAHAPGAAHGWSQEAEQHHLARVRQPGQATARDALAAG